MRTHYTYLHDERIKLSFDRSSILDDLLSLSIHLFLRCTALEDNHIF
jgi:hypothetical protein